MMSKPLFSLLQSWRAFVNSIRYERFQPYLIIAFTLWLVGAVEIIQKTGGQGLDPRFWMAVAILITLYSGSQIFRLYPARRTFVRSRTSGAVNDLMTRLAANGLTIYHAGCEQKEGGTYVAVGRAGIYAMEIKTGNVFGSGAVEYKTDNELILGGRISDCRPLKQARRTARQISERLGEMLQTKSAVRPLVVFMNDWRVNRSEMRSEVAVVSAAEVGQFLGQQKPILSRSEIQKITNCLSDPAFADRQS
jgi:hypothetical protein